MTLEQFLLLQAKVQEQFDYANKIDKDRIGLIEKLEVLSKSLDEVRYENEHNSQKLVIIYA